MLRRQRGGRPRTGSATCRSNYDNIVPGASGTWGYNVIRLPISWNNLEPVAPVWNATASTYVHTWNQTYLNDLKSMVTKAHAAGLMVILDMHQDYWSPALHTSRTGTARRATARGSACRAGCTRRSTPRPATTQNVDFYNGMNWFYRNIQDPLSTVTHATPVAALLRRVGPDRLPVLAGVGLRRLARGGRCRHPQRAVLSATSAAAHRRARRAAGRGLPAADVLQRDRADDHRPPPELAALLPGLDRWLQRCQPGRPRDADDDREADGARQLGVLDPHLQLQLRDVHRRRASGTTTSASRWRTARWPTPTRGRCRSTSASSRTSLWASTRGSSPTRRWRRRESFLSWAKQNRVSWTFWAYVNPYWPMTVVNYATNQAIPVVKHALETGLDGPGGERATRGVVHEHLQPARPARSTERHRPIRTARSPDTRGTSVTGRRAAHPSPTTRTRPLGPIR